MTTCGFVAGPVSTLPPAGGQIRHCHSAGGQIRRFSHHHALPCRTSEHPHQSKPRRHDVPLGGTCDRSHRSTWAHTSSPLQVQSASPFPCQCRCDSAASASPLPIPRRSHRLSPPKSPRDHATMSRRHHHEPPPPACCSCCGCGSGSSAPAPCGYYPAPSPPPPASGSDHLLHAIAAHLLLTSAPPPPPPQHQHQHQPQPQQQPPPAAHHANLYSYAYQYQHPKSHAAYPQAQPPPPQQQQQANPPDHGHLLLHSLLRRVAALETTLPHCFPSPPVPLPHLQPNPRPQYRAAVHQEAPPSPPPPRRGRGGAPSARELAARTIQEHFRRFLARRSRTLRQLKELAILRSKAASLRGSLSGSGRRRCGDPAAISEAAMGLLLHLDGIQGADPMIWEGKRAASREVSRILEFVDKVLVKEHEEMAIGGELDNDEYREGCRGAFVVNRPTMNKKVSFYGNEAENGADESSESSSCSSSAEADERKGTNGKKSANGKPGLAAPVPVHMESRTIAGEKR